MVARTDYRRLTTLIMIGAIAVGSCMRDRGVTEPPEEPPAAPRYVTPTGMVTANAPEIFLGAGDISTCSNNNDEATAQILDTIPGTVFALGDNVYEDGTTSEFNNCYDPTWGRHKARTKPSAGNHEYNTSGAGPYYQYFGAAAGDPDKGYYSYNLGAWHIVVINSNISRSTGSAQDTWLVNDLEASTSLCTAAYFHHPLYSSTGGSGNGGVTYSSMRPVYDRLYEYGVDVILAGHRHHYERLAPMKPDGTSDPVNGFRTFIAGMGGRGGGGTTNQHPLSEIANGSTFGILKMYLYDDSYAWKFIPEAGKTFSDSGSAACIGEGSPGGGGGGVSASQSTVSAAPASIAASNGSSTATITVTAKDGSGNPVSGATVTLAATGSGNTLTQPAGPTNANGVATGTLSSTGAGTKTVSAQISGTAITQTATVTVATGPPSGSQSTVSASPTTVGIGGAATITVTVKDGSGNLVSGAAVTLSATGGGNTLTQPASPTNASGVTTGTLSSTVAGTKTVSAIAGSTAIALTATVTVSDQPAGTIAHALLTVGTGPNNSSEYTTASITPAPNALVTVAVTAHRSSGTRPPPTLSGGGMSAWDEVATATFDDVGSPKRRVTVYRAMSAAPGSGPITISFQGNVSNAQWIVSQWMGVATSGTNGSGAIGQTGTSATDLANGLAVSLASFANAGNVGYGVFSVVSDEAAITSGAAFTQIAQQPSGDRTPGDLMAEWAVNRALIDASWSSLAGAAIGVEIKAGTPVVVTPTSLAFAVPPSQTTAGAPITPAVQVEVRDQFGARMTTATNGVTMAIGTNPAAGTLAGTVTKSAVNGVATFSDLSIDRVGTGYTLTAQATGLTAAVSAPFNVTGVPVSQALSTVTASPGTIAASTGTSVATITVTARDAGGNPMSGASVVLAATGTGNTITQPAGTTNTSGVVTGAVSYTVAGTKTVSATINGTPITQTAAVTVQAGPPSASQSTIGASPTLISVGSGSSTVTVTAKDDFGNPVGNASVLLAATGSGNTLTQPTGPTNVSGVATGALSSTVAGSKTVSATAGGTAIAATATVQVSDLPAGTITHSLLTVGADPANGTDYTTASISPAPNALITVAVTAYRSYGSDPPPTLTGGGMSNWDVVATEVFDDLVAPRRRVTVYRAMSASPGSGPITISFAGNVSNAQWIVSQWTGAETSGTNGTGAIGQTGTSAADFSNGLSTTLGAFGNPSNVAYGVFAVASNEPAVAPGTGFTQIAQQTSGENTPGDLMAERAVNRSLINASWSSLAGAMLGIEIKVKTSP